MESTTYHIMDKNELEKSILAFTDNPKIFNEKNWLDNWNWICANSLKNNELDLAHSSIKRVADRIALIICTNSDLNSQLRNCTIINSMIFYTNKKLLEFSFIKKKIFFFCIKIAEHLNESQEKIKNYTQKLNFLFLLIDILKAETDTKEILFGFKELLNFSKLEKPKEEINFSLEKDFKIKFLDLAETVITPNFKLLFDQNSRLLELYVNKIVELKLSVDVMNSGMRKKFLEFLLEKKEKKENDNNSYKSSQYLYFSLEIVFITKVQKSDPLSNLILKICKSCSSDVYQDDFKQISECIFRLQEDFNDFEKKINLQKIEEFPLKIVKIKMNKKYLFEDEILKVRGPNEYSLYIKESKTVCISKFRPPSIRPSYFKQKITILRNFEQRAENITDKVQFFNKEDNPNRKIATGLCLNEFHKYLLETVKRIFPTPEISHILVDTKLKKILKRPNLSFQKNNFSDFIRPFMESKEKITKAFIICQRDFIPKRFFCETKYDLIATDYKSVYLIEKHKIIIHKLKLYENLQKEDNKNIEGEFYGLGELEFNSSLGIGNMDSLHLIGRKKILVVSSYRNFYCLVDFNKKKIYRFFTNKSMRFVAFFGADIGVLIEGGVVHF